MRAANGCWSAAWLLALPLGCEPRVAEPAPATPPAPPSATAAGGTAAAASLPAAPSLPSAPTAAGPVVPLGRCVRPTPPVPTRPTPPPGPDPRCPPDPTGPPALRHGLVRVPEAGPVAVDVEIAERNADRMRGLMYRTRLDENAGMLFVFEEREELRFWMRNTCLPLDMLFIDDDGLIAGIEENVPTLNDDGYGVGCKASYVLEVNAGWARRHAVKAGQHVAIDGL